MIRDRYRKGMSISGIAREAGRDRKTIRKIIQTGTELHLLPQNPVGQGLLPTGLGLLTACGTSEKAGHRPVWASVLFPLRRAAMSVASQT